MLDAFDGRGADRVPDDPAMRLSALLDADIRQFTKQSKRVQSYDAIYLHLVTLVLKRNEPTLRWATQTIR